MASLLTVSQSKNPVPGNYIVTLKKGVSLASHLSSIQTNIASTTSNITHEYSLINGYAGEFTDGDLNDLRANPDIAAIEQDSVFEICGAITQSVLPRAYLEQADRSPTEFDRTNAPWGLGRISSVKKLTGNDRELNFTYKYDSTAGKGVTVYIIGRFPSLEI